MTPSAPRTRRAENAQATRQAILEAAQHLFAERGYFACQVKDIAQLARVAPVTVYAVGGGKSGLLRTLIEEAGKSEDVHEILERITGHTDPPELLHFIVEATRAKFDTWSPLMRQVIQAAPQEPTVRDCLEIANADIRNGLALTANRLAELGALPAGLDAQGASDILWYYLGNSSYFTLTDDLGWPLPRAAEWLYDTLAAVLLRETERGHPGRERDVVRRTGEAHER